MNISSQLFLRKGDAEYNLNLLSSNTASGSSRTQGVTKEVYDKVPKMDISPSTLREISIVSSLTAIFSGPFLFGAKKVSECLYMGYQGNIQDAKTCGDELIGAFNKPVNVMTYLCFASCIALLATGLYAGTRNFFQDAAQRERFELLDSEYKAVSEYLQKQYNESNKQAAVTAAQNLINNKELISLNLKEGAKLSDIQVQLLTAKIQRTADRIIKHDSDHKKLMADVEREAKSQKDSPKRSSPLPVVTAGQKPFSLNMKFPHQRGA